ncbi:hypothetical protein EES37_18860 [Streptomyces sp. ADI91-18]|nr:hypothetical protein EES37_18860 [Streptomyces sp. ADI91-18]
MHNAAPEPELPARVPEKRNARTPDLPPLGPEAPDIPDPAVGQPRPEAPEKGGSEEGEQPVAGPGNTKPQEPTD